MKRSLGWLMILSSGAAFAQTPNAPVLSIGNGFYSDPYGGYPCHVADTTFTGTDGTNTTVSWNGSTITAPTYHTVDAAINAAAAVNGGGGQRVCLLAGQTWARAAQSPIMIPNLTGTTSSNRFVIQGDPAATASTMPIVTGNGTEGYGLVVGGAPPFTGAAARSVNNSYVTIRKVEITNFVGSSNSVGAINLTANNYNGFVVEYCKMHLFRQIVGPGGGGPVYVNSIKDTATFEVRYNKMYDNLMTDGTTQSRPFAGVETYGGVFSIHHNEFYEMDAGYAGKVLTPQSPNGSIFKNLFHDVTQAIEFEPGGEWTGINGISIYGNLFYWEHLNDSVFGAPNGATAYNDAESNGNTTYPTGVSFYNNTVSQEIGGSGNLAFWNHYVSNVQVYNNIFLGGYPMAVMANTSQASFSLCDYNFYNNPQIFYLNLYGTPQSVGNFAAWRAAHTTYPSFTGLSTNPDAHSVDIYALSSPWNTLAANFPNYAKYDYTIASGSPLLGSGQGGATPGYNPNDVGPGW